MFSDFMSWIIKTVCGIVIDEDNIGELNFIINPYIFDELEYAKCRYETNKGLICIEWNKNPDGCIVLTVDIADGVTAFYNGGRLKEGKNRFEIEV